MPGCHIRAYTAGRLKSWRCHKHDDGQPVYTEAPDLGKVASIRKHKLWLKADGKRHGRVKA